MHSPGFPVADRPFYTPGIVDTLAALAKRHEITVRAVQPPPKSGVHHYRGLRILAADESFERKGFDVSWCLWPNRTFVAVPFGPMPFIVSLMGGELAQLPELDYGSARRELVGLLVPLARILTVGSEPMRITAREHFPKIPIRIAPMGVDGARITRVRERPWVRGETLRLIAVSDLSPVKRVPLAIAALDRLLAQGIDATLDVFGDPRHRIAPVHDRMKHHGFIDPAALATKLADYHVLVHPSAHESQGFALIEAALARLPIACAHVGVADELAELGAAVERVDHPAPAELADAILRAAVRSDDARDKVRARFDIEPCAARFEAIIEEVARR